MLTALFSSRLYGTAYNVVDHARPRTADDLWVNHGSVAIVAGAHIALSPVDISDQRAFEIVCARAHVGCFAAIVVLLYRPGSQPLPQQQQTFVDELTPVL